MLQGLFIGNYGFIFRNCIFLNSNHWLKFRQKYPKRGSELPDSNSGNVLWLTIENLCNLRFLLIKVVCNWPYSGIKHSRIIALTSPLKTKFTKAFLQNFAATLELQSHCVLPTLVTREIPCHHCRHSHSILEYGQLNATQMLIWLAKHAICMFSNSVDSVST